MGLYAFRPDIFADASFLPFTDQSVDSVIMLEVVEHVAKPNRAFKEVQRVLKPEGMLLLSLPFLYPIHDESHDYQRLTRYGLQPDRKEAGLECKQLGSSLHSLASAGLLINLSISGSILEAIH